MKFFHILSCLTVLGLLIWLNQMIVPESMPRYGGLTGSGWASPALGGGAAGLVIIFTDSARALVCFLAGADKGAGVGHRDGARALGTGMGLLDGRVAVVTDSTAYLPAVEAGRLDVRVVPLQVVVAGDSYDEGTPEASDVLLAALHAHVPVTTSRPSPAPLFSSCRWQSHSRSGLAVH